MISCRCLFLPKTKNFYFINDHLTIWSSPTNDHATQRPIKWKCAGQGRKFSSRKRARLILFKSVLLFRVTYCSENRISKFIFFSRLFPQFLFQFWWEIIFCYLVGFWPAVFCRKGKYLTKTVLCCWAIFLLQSTKALWWWYSPTHNLYSGNGHQNSSLWRR